MTIDILIPTYNRKFLLEKAIKSILQQSYKHINIIISDNNSDDWTCKYIKKYVDNKNIFYFKNTQNIGSLHNCRKLIYEYSKSDYVLFLSDDDELYDKKYIEKCVNIIQKNKQVVIVMSNTMLFYDDLNLRFYEKKKLKNITKWKDFFLQYGSGDYSISWCSALFNKKIALQNNCYNGKVFYADSDCFFRLMMFWNIAFIDTIGAIYRLHSKNSYKIVDLDTYIKNIDYIKRNYHFAKNFIDKQDLKKWKERMILGYWGTVYSNIILFNRHPIKNLWKLKKYIKNNNINIETSFLQLLLLFIARIWMKIKFVHRKMIIIHNKK